jgi:hypothetical protein
LFDGNAYIVSPAGFAVLFFELDGKFGEHLVSNIQHNIFKKKQLKEIQLTK